MDVIGFVASSHEFLFRHFSPALAAAKTQVERVVAFLPEQSNGTTSSVDGIEVVHGPLLRGLNSPFAVLKEAIWLARECRKLRPAIMVAYSLRMCVILRLAGFFLPSTRFVFVVTGTGFLGIAKSFASRLLSNVVFRLIRGAPRDRSHYIFENSFDAISLGLSDRDRSRISFLMGAGVDEERFPMVGAPCGPPFRFATVSRLVWSKGIDIAARAISSLATEGYPVELHVYGAPDPANPRPLKAAEFWNLRAVKFHGISHDVASVWRDHHAAIFTSRGGEGLPRALLEAASCGRACIVTSVPGCADFIRDGIEGHVVPLGSDAALKEAILKLVSKPERFSILGERARDRVLTSSTAKIIQDKYEGIFGLLLAQSNKRRRPHLAKLNQLTSRE